MNQIPLVTIVTPSLNQGNYIRATIDSILSQNYPNLEYWVIDGGSNDETLEILRSYGERIHWVSEADEGQSNAVNKGWLRAHGEILGWVNADDVLLPGALHHVVKSFDEEETCAVVYGGCFYIDAQGKTLGEYPTYAYDYATLLIEAENFIPQPATFVRHQAAKKVGLLDESLHYVMDFDFWLRLGARYNFCYLPTPLAALRIHGATKTGTTIARFAPELERVYHRIFSLPELSTDLHAQEARAWAYLYHRAASYSFWGGAPARARTYLKKSWSALPLWRTRSFWLLMLFSLFGQAGYNMAERLHGNPFHSR